MKSAADNYIDLMVIIRNRIDTIKRLKSLDRESFYLSESIALHGRKIVEAIAFCCLLAIDNSFKTVPREAIGQYNAEKIFKALKRKGVQTLQNPSVIRAATEEEMLHDNVSVIIQGIPEKCLTYDELINMYQELHRWLHELNPYIKSNHIEFNTKHYSSLLNIISKIEEMISHHVITVNGVGFYCTLRDESTGETTMIALSKVSSC